MVRFEFLNLRGGDYDLKFFKGRGSANFPNYEVSPHKLIVGQKIFQFFVKKRGFLRLGKIFGGGRI